MIITDSSIGMDSTRKYTSVSTDAYIHTRSVKTMSASDFAKRLNELSKSGKAISPDEEQNSVIEDETSKKKNKKDGKVDKDKADTLSDNPESTLDYLKGKFNEIKTARIANTSKQEEDLRSAIRYMCLNLLLMLLIKNSGDKGENLFERAFGPSGGKALDFSGIQNGFQFTETTDTVIHEHLEAEYEETTFDAKGIVKTSDGRSIDFGISLTMSRGFEQYIQDKGVGQSFAATLMDPLVINFDTNAAEIPDQKFYFDLDSDGNLDEVASLSSNSGFLALDLNNDGEINNGSELFGTKSGDGFKDLAAYDKDGNGFIDEADEVFNKLKIFCINEDGTTTQYSLKDKGVGAIYLGSKETQFDVTDQENNLNARVRRTGVFLYETGSVGTVQHVDLKVELGA